VKEALGYLDRCLDAGFRPGMGHIVPDRLFWAQPDPDLDETELDTEAAALFDLPAHDTKH
jgi:hydroxymethylpyrimidine/phosphomethylpyrimidine kinase